jgi:hypothetical protein
MPVKRICIEPGCNRTTTGSRCPVHQAARRQAKYGGTWRRDSERRRAEHIATHGPICPGWQRPPHTVDPRTLHVDHDLGILCGSCNDTKAATFDKTGGDQNL